ncbi:MAG: polysaccharide biosynthesis protein [Cryobacterium sp.]|nr:polysaccharide biosynthesis protein [Cryobacterium sp.]
MKQGSNQVAVETSGSLTRRILGFAGIPFVSLLIPFLFLPILARVAGAEAWLAIAIGQSIGGFFALFVALGYNTVGPTEVAKLPPGQRPALLLASLPARAILLLPCIAVSLVLALLISPAGFRAEAGLMSIAMLLAGMSSAWFMIGDGRPVQIMLFELVPRLLATIVASGLLLFLGQVIWYPIALIVAATIGTGWYDLRVLALRSDNRGPRLPVFATIKQNVSAMLIEVVGGAYNSLAVTFVSLTASSPQAANYVSGDKLYRIGQYSDSALGNALQGWVVEAGSAKFRERAKKSILLHLVLGALGLLGFAILGPWLTSMLFGSKVSMDEPTSIGFGVAVLGVAIATALGRITLVGLGKRLEYLIAVGGAAVVGVPAILVLAKLFGAAGGAWGLAASEIALVLVLIGFVARSWQKIEPTFDGVTRKN